MATSLKYPTNNTTQSVGSESSDDWVSIGSIGADDATYASITAATYDLNDICFRAKAQGFGFTIPEGQVIDGIQVEIERSKQAGSAVDFRVQLLDEAGALVGNDKADTVTAWPTTDTIATYGGATDLWGWLTADQAVSRTKINDADFGVVLSVKATGNNTDIRVDFIRITISYSAHNPAYGAGNLLQSDLSISRRHSAFSTKIVESFSHGVGGTNFGQTIDQNLDTYTCDQAVADKIWKFSQFTSTIKSSFVATTVMTDVTWDRTDLYHNDQGTLKSYRHSAFTSTVKVSFAYAAADEPGGITWDGTNFYTVDEGTSNKQKKHSAFTSTLKDSIASAGGAPRTNAWDNTNYYQNALTQDKIWKNSAFTTTIKASISVTGDRYGMEWDDFPGANAAAEPGGAAVTYGWYGAGWW